MPDSCLASTEGNLAALSWPVDAAFVRKLWVLCSQNFIRHGVGSSCKSGETIQAQPEVCNEDRSIYAGVISNCRALAPFRSLCLKWGKFVIRYRWFLLQRKEYGR